MFSRDFYKQILPAKLHNELFAWNNEFKGIQTKKGDHFLVFFSFDPTPAQDIEIAQIVTSHVPSSSFLDQQELTDTRNKEGFELYKQIFSHISDVQPITSIDNFIDVTDELHKLRNFLKDGNFETAVRYMYIKIKPIMETEGTVLHGLDFNLYHGWVRDIALKYNSNLSYNCGLINPAFIGGPFENTPFIDYIELAPQGMV